MAQGFCYEDCSGSAERFGALLKISPATFLLSREVEGGESFSFP